MARTCGDEVDCALRAPLSCAGALRRSASSGPNHLLWYNSHDIKRDNRPFTKFSETEQWKYLKTTNPWRGGR